LFFLFAINLEFTARPQAKLAYISCLADPFPEFYAGSKIPNFDAIFDQRCLCVAAV